LMRLIAKHRFARRQIAVDEPGSSGQSGATRLSQERADMS
jgi:hypothetical protein